SAPGHGHRLLRLRLPDLDLAGRAPDVRASRRARSVDLRRPDGPAGHGAHRRPPPARRRSRQPRGGRPLASSRAHARGVTRARAACARPRVDGGLLDAEALEAGVELSATDAEVTGRARLVAPGALEGGDDR